jgi:cytochrome c oxidase subunit III
MPDPNRAFSPSMYWIGHLAGLASIFAIFAALGIGYWLRSENMMNWQPVQLPQQLTLSTIFLLAASVAMEMARFVWKRAGLQQYSTWLIRTAIFGTAFVITQGLCWRVILRETAIGNSNERFFYVLTGAHAIHVLGGMLALGYLIWRVWHPWTEFAELRRNTLTAIVASYWHFMSVIWLGLYALLAAKAST